MKKILLILALAAVGATDAQAAGAALMPKKGDTIVVMTRARFSGGDFQRWIAENAHKELVRSRGIVKVSFIIEPNGELSDFEVTSSPDRVLSEKALEIVKKSPPWKPATRTARIKGGAILATDLPVTTKVHCEVWFNSSTLDVNMLSLPNIQQTGLIEYRPDQSTYIGKVSAYDNVLYKPAFEGSTPDKFADWLRANVKFAKKKGAFKSGLAMTITPSGRPDGVKVIGAPDKAAVDAIIDAIAKAPQWRPGLDDDHRPIAVSVFVLVDF